MPADFAWRMEHAAEQADAAGLTGVLVAPGPDLVYFTGYMPVAITERLTLLALQKGREPVDDHAVARAPRRRERAERRRRSS